MDAIRFDARVGRWVRATLFAAAAMVVAFLVSLVVRSVGSYWAPLDGWWVALFEMAMGLLCASRFYERSWRSASSAAKAFPLVLGGACGSWALGDLILTAAYGGNAPVPSAADAFYAGFFPLAFLSLMLLVRRGNAKSLVKTGLDGLIAGLGAASLCAAYLFEPVRRAIGGSALSAATKMAYPVGDLLLLALAIGGFAVLPKRYRLFLVLTCVAMAANATGDVCNLLSPDSRMGFVANGAAWPVALLMLATAMWTLPARAQRVESERADDFVLPTLGVVAGMFILLTDSLGHASQAAVGFATATLLVAGVRMTLNVREGQALKTARFRSLIDKTWDLIVVVEEDLSVAYITPSSDRVLGYDPNELQDHPITAKVHPDDADVVRTRLGELAGRSTESAAFEIRMRHGNGAWRTIAWTATNLLADPSVRGYVLNGSDVTEARQAAEDLAAARDGALMASKAKSQFLSTMSHEIRTPMNGVIGLTELLLTTTLDPDQHELASGIKTSAESLLVIINDILDFSKIEAGKLDLEEAALDVPGVVDDVGRILAGPAHKKGLELIIDVETDVPASLVGERVRLQQVLLNLGSNAVKFTEEGEVVIRAMVLHEDTERVALRFEVVDMGIGIAPEDQKRLFRAFAQADSSTTRRFGGTGLGLAISRQLIELMGGRLGLISAPGEGSTFWFELSLPRGDDAVTTEDGDPGSVEDLRALIVDDNATNRRILRQHLLSWGAQPAEANDAYEAMQIAATAAEAGQPFDIGVVDLNMPGMDGIELAQHLKANPATAGITLFLLSSSGERLGAAESHLRGFAASLTKPVRSSELFDCLISNLRAESAAALPAPPPDSDQLETAEVTGVILLVEDNKMNQLVGSKALAKLGYSVDIANDGREAVSAIQAKAYDAVLMDCQMPEMDGYEATAEIRRIEGDSRHTPIIAMTAAAMEGDRQTCLTAGMDDYITKPVRLDVIEAVLERWIDRSDVRDPDDRGPFSDHFASEPLDQGQLDRLRSLDGGDGSLLGEIIEQYLAQTTQGRNELDRVMTVGDAEALRRTAHTIKGASANVGAAALAGVCAEIEMCGRRADLEGAAGLVQRFDAEFARVRDALTLVAPRG